MPGQSLLRSPFGDLVSFASEVHAREASLRADPDRLVGQDEAAAITHLTLPSLAVYRSTGRLLAATKPHQRVKYRVGDLLAYVEKYGSGRRA